MECERCKIEFFPDELDHVFVVWRVWVRILRNFGVFPFMAADIAARDEVVDAFRAGEIDESARIDQRRTCDAHVGFLAAVGIKTRGLFTELRPAHDRVVAENELFVFNKAGDGDKLH